MKSFKIVLRASWNSRFLWTPLRSRAEEGEETMSDSTVKQTKETLYTVILLNFTKKEKKMLQIISRLNKLRNSTIQLHESK